MEKHELSFHLLVDMPSHEGDRAFKEDEGCLASRLNHQCLALISNAGISDLA